MRKFVDRNDSPKYTVAEIQKVFERNPELSAIVSSMGIDNRKILKYVRIEMEHGNSGPKGKTLDVLPDDSRGRDRLSYLVKIVLSHLSERSDYYELLEKYVEKK